MFGMGFMEILLVAIIAIIALGPEKLPTAMVEIAKFLKKFKSGIDDAKSTLDSELNISDMKAEASKFKAQIENAKSSVSLDNLSKSFDVEDDEPLITPLKKEETKEEITIEEETTSKKETVKASDKFKVKKNEDDK
ncbi:MAG: twin-arginine translocase subunit TatB [Arcobacter sp.]|nr:MAG: twin-arginine translocase subunit TatB [Arcobacter sp.]